jgi:Family of unknown function (DUF5998)
MRETRVMTEDLRVAIERSGYYPGLVTDAVASALGLEPVTAFFVHHDAIFDPGMEVRRHMTVLALTPTRLVYSHTDEHPAEEPDERPRAETSTEAIRFSRVSLTRVVPDPASYVPGVTMPSEVILTIGWNVLSHVELEPAHCGDDTCEADHGYLGTITADDLTLRVSEAADGEEAVRQVLSFVSALSEATARAGNLPTARTVCSNRRAGPGLGAASLRARAVPPRVGRGGAGMAAYSEQPASNGIWHPRADEDS